MDRPGPAQFLLSAHNYDRHTYPFNAREVRWAVE